MSVALFAIIFSHSEGCLVTLFIVSLVVQKLLILFYGFLCCDKAFNFNKFPFVLVVVFISIAIGNGSKKTLAVIYVREYFAYGFL